MKTSWVASAAIAFALGVTPIAYAQQADTAATLALSSGATPTQAVDVRYPYREARDRTEGRCTVLFDVTAEGETTNLRTESCSSRDFEREAVRVASTLRYGADALPADGLRDQSFTFKWEGEGG